MYRIYHRDYLSSMWVVERVSEKNYATFIAWCVTNHREIGPVDLLPQETESS